uniref:Uncharacterized protein n=1 Tax=Romanomermis culicivorax TaxID=13658 RepID=A0A915K8V8_ROMCU
MDVVGEPGYQCKTHRDCKPGLCCHINTDKLLNGQTTLSKCVEHRLNRSQACLNSCQCVFGLNCYKNSSFNGETKDNVPVERIVTQTAIFRSTGVCKTPVTDDILHGNYLNSDDSFFRLTDDK